jgi:hypothetical protein
MTRARRTGRGQAMVEFALIAPIFFLVLFAIVEGGRFMFYYEALNHATREGARYAIVNGANSLGCPTGPPAPNSTPCDTAGDDVVDRVRSSAYGMPPSSIAVIPTWNPNNGRGSIVNVQASLTTLVPLLPLPPITVTAESSLVVNN